MSESEVKNYPLEVIADECFRHYQNGHHFHQKFSCAKCGTRQTMEAMDQIYAAGICEECGHETNLRENGCNYLLIASTKKA